jgi:pimeloyl-ACP methyl ester carboxylesterase
MLSGSSKNACSSSLLGFHRPSAIWTSPWKYASLRYPVANTGGSVGAVATFVLVHGAWHGAWVWDKLRGELAARGHDSIAMDLPVSDGSATCGDYATVIEDSMKELGEPPILVGHSLAGMAVPIVASRTPVQTLVFLCAVVPSLTGDHWAGTPEPAAPGTFAGIEERDDGSTVWVDMDNAIYSFYQDWDREEAVAGFKRLRPQNSSSLWAGPYPLTEWPACRIVSIFTTNDRSIGPAYSRYVASERLGVEPLEFHGDHSPFLSQPGTFADFLIQATT